MRPAENNMRVTWDPNLQGGNRLTAKKDIPAHRGAPEGDLTSTQEVQGEGTLSKGNTPTDTPTTTSSHPSAPKETDRLDSNAHDGKVLAFDTGDDVLVTQTMDVAMDDPAGNGELALGEEPLPLDSNISKLKRRKKPKKIRDPWRRMGVNKPKVRRSTRVIPAKPLPKQKLYPDAKEDVPTDSPTPKGKEIRITVFVDANHARDKVTRRSVTGILLLLNNTPIRAYCKRQCTIETSTYGSEMVAARIAVEIILEIRYALRMLGVPIEKTSLLMGDNNSVLLNTTLPSSMLKKKHLGCSYHRIREAVAAKIIDFAYIPSDQNYANILTKPLSTQAHHQLSKPRLFCRAKVIDKAAKIDERKTLMTSVIRTDDEQDQREQLIRRRQYLSLFKQQLQEITQNGQRSELFRLVLQDI